MVMRATCSKVCFIFKTESLSATTRADQYRGRSRRQKNAKQDRDDNAINNQTLVREQRECMCSLATSRIIFRRRQLNQFFYPINLPQTLFFCVCAEDKNRVFCSLSTKPPGGRADTSCIVVTLETCFDARYAVYISFMILARQQ